MKQAWRCWPTSISGGGCRGMASTSAYPTQRRSKPSARVLSAWTRSSAAIGDERPTTGDDWLGITGAFCAIAETGTLVILSGADTPTATTLLPDTHIAVLRADRIVPGMEEAFALIRRERTALPRAINMISGPS